MNLFSYSRALLLIAALLLFPAHAQAEKLTLAGSSTLAPMIAVLPVEGVAATSAAVKNGSYPLSRPLKLVTRGVPKGAAKAFIEFVQSPRAREVIAEYDFVPYGH